MKKVLVDTSVWIDSFRGGKTKLTLSEILDKDSVCINMVIKAELIPSLVIQNQRNVIDLLQKIQEIPLFIDWDELTQIQTELLKAGINGIGLPDLIIVQNAIQGKCSIYSLDNHFVKINQVISIDLVGK